MSSGKWRPFCLNMLNRIFHFNQVNAIPADAVMPWFLASPGHQHVWYWLCIMGRFLCHQDITSHGHDDAIKWKHFPHYWPFVQGIHRSPVNSLHKGQWHGALMFSLICAWINNWINNHEAGDLRRHQAHYDVTVMYWLSSPGISWFQHHND